ncbi:hypothetical protein CQ014_05995 [Pseudomonas lurida]|nr:hypothetical protein CLM75_04325 [Pseudomonas lurida]PRA18816.1 hypothetical protein CQ002_05975 [Pseudomonas sp. MYb13]PRA24523.1 hypothetical protein CQ004_05995 [Pseudomonas lurida]PRA38878.1 hypothetical protein CQ005_02805 [Pseudomonas lurida]PRC03467.1 hypothetical protein CQ014_05995 [Pseudomonas lurida]
MTYHRNGIGALIMENPVPGLTITVTGPFDQAEISLSTFTGPLVVFIPEDARLFPEGTVYAILGADPEEPAWSGDKISAGECPEDAQDYQQLPNLTVEVPKSALERFADQTTLLRYQTIGESSVPLSSAPISLTINR